MAQRVEVWGGNVGCSPGRIAEPEGVDDVVQLVREAAAQGVCIRPAGSLHSWSAVALTDDWMLRFGRMVGATRLSDTRVRVLAGTPLWWLNQWLDARGLAIGVLGSVDHQTIAGACATGTHGSGSSYGHLGTLLRRVRIVDGTGEVRVFEQGDADFEAFRVHLGALGIVTDVDLEVEPAFHLAEVTTVVPVERAIAELPELLHRARFAKLWWLPHTSDALLFTAEKTQEPARSSRLSRWLDQHVVNDVVFRGLLAVSGRVNPLVPWVNRLTRPAYFQQGRRVAKSTEVFHLAMPPRHRETEWAIPLDRGGEALGALVERVRVDGLRVNFIQEARIVAADHGWLSPTYRDARIHLGTYTANPADCQALFAGAQHDGLALDGRPHWGKEHGLEAEQLAKLYPQWSAFHDLRRRLDPDRRLASPMLDALWGA